MILKAFFARNDFFVKRTGQADYSHFAQASHILKALVIRACAQEWAVRYTRCVDLIDNLYAGLADGSYERRMKRWCRPLFLVIDDVGLGQLKQRDDEATAAHMLFTLLDRRHAATSTAITSNLKLSAWGKYLGDVTLAG